MHEWDSCCSLVNQLAPFNNERAGNTPTSYKETCCLNISIQYIKCEYILLEHVFLQIERCARFPNHPWKQGLWDDMGPIWGRQDPGGPHVGPMNVAIWDDTLNLFMC